MSPLIKPIAPMRRPGAGMSEKERETRTNQISLIISLFLLSLAGAVIITAIRQVNPQIIVPAVVLISAFMLQILMSQGMLIKDPTKKIFVVNFSLYGALILFTIYFSGTAIATAGFILIFSLLCSITLLEDEKADSIVPIALMAAIFAGLLGTYSPITQVSVPLFSYAMTVSFALEALTLGIFLFGGIVVASLSVKITLAALSIVILPLILVSLINSNYLRSTLLAETRSNMVNSSNLLAKRIEEFIQTNRQSIASEAAMPLYANYLKLATGQRSGSAQEKQLLTAMTSIKAAMKTQELAYLDTLKVVDGNGYIVYSTRPTEVGMNVKDRSYFDYPASTTTVFDSPVEFSPSDGKPYIYFSQAVRDSDQRVAGVLVISYNANILQSIARDYVTEAGGYPIILDDNFLRIADPTNEKYLYTMLVPTNDDYIRLLRSRNRLPNLASSSLFTNQPEFAAGLKNAKQTPFFITNVANDGKQYYTSVYKMSGQSWYVAFVRDQSVVEASLDNQTRLAIIIATLIAGAISMLATYIAQAFSHPISQLTAVAEEVSAGNLEARSTVTSKDEIGVLAKAFNTMTGQLQEFIASLEDRIQARTHELAERNDALTFRARQLETIADVARGVTQTQSLENLLNEVAQLISERFNFYHVGIFLIDSSGKFAVLRAANSEGGQRMLKRQHRLEVGHAGIVGYVTSSGQARIATDVGQDAVFFNNPDLPLTRSEMSLPLIVGDRITGALDVQSTESAAFSEEDIQLFRILADQVAMAIYNNQLYMETSQALHEAQLVHQRYLQQEWSRETTQNQHTAYRYTPAGITPVPQNEINLTGALEEARAVEEDGKQTLAVPVKLRGETIGVIRIQEERASGSGWAEDEVNTVQAVADQVALALENARLFSQTTRKAERERRVLEITSRIRSTNDPQVMMQIAVEELQRTLQASRAQVVLQPGQHGQNGGNGRGPNGNGSNGRHGQQDGTNQDPDPIVRG